MKTMRVGLMNALKLCTESSVIFSDKSKKAINSILTAMREENVSNTFSFVIYQRGTCGSSILLVLENLFYFLESTLY